jgi:hypothetical protein
MTSLDISEVKLLQTFFLVRLLDTLHYGETNE